MEVNMQYSAEDLLEAVETIVDFIDDLLR